MNQVKMGKLQDYERLLSKGQTEKQLVQLLKEMELTTKFVTCDNQCEVAHLELHNKYGVLVSSGSGKGENFEVGAVAEAYEHYVLQMTAGDKFTLAPFNKIKQQSIFHNDYFIQSIVSNKLVATTEFLSGQQKFQIPLNYVNPYFSSTEQDYDVESILSRYSSNLGTSMGMSFADAYLHGINEAIERHYTSYLFEDLINKHSSHNWNIITAPNYKRTLIEDKFGEVVTISTQTNFSSTVAFSFLVKSRESDYIITPMGAGCSYFSKLAIQRSLDELMQCLELYTDEEISEDLFARQVLTQYKGLHPLIKISRQSLEDIAYGSKDNIKMQEYISVSDQIVSIVEKLTKYNYCVLHRVLERSAHCCIVQILIPGFERFHLIRSGQLVIPQSEFKEAVA